MTALLVEDEMDAGVAGRYECRLDRKDFSDSIRGEDLCRTAVGYHPAPIEQNHIICKTRGEIQIVNYAHGDYVRPIRERAHFLHEIHLMTNVEKRKRLVEEEITA